MINDPMLLLFFCHRHLTVTFFFSSFTHIFSCIYISIIIISTFSLHLGFKFKWVRWNTEVILGSDAQIKKCSTSFSNPGNVYVLGGNYIFHFLITYLACNFYFYCQPGIDGVRLLAVKFIEAMVLLYTPDPTLPSDPPQEIDGTHDLFYSIRFSMNILL